MEMVMERVRACRHMNIIDFVHSALANRQNALCTNVTLINLLGYSTAYRWIFNLISGIDVLKWQSTKPSQPYKVHSITIIAQIQFVIFRWFSCPSEFQSHLLAQEREIAISNQIIRIFSYLCVQLNYICFTFFLMQFHVLSRMHCNFNRTFLNWIYIYITVGKQCTINNDYLLCEINCRENACRF